MPDLLLEKTESVAILKLNRPDRMNAISFDMIRELGEALAQIDDDPSMRCIVVTGEGRGFCSGLDLKDASSGDDSITGMKGVPKIAETPPFVMRRLERKYGRALVQANYEQFCKAS